MFDVFPGKAEINRTIRVALYLVLDFTVSLFFMEGVVRFFLCWKKCEENPQNETFIKQTTSFFHSLDKISVCDIVIFVVMFSSFFFKEIGLEFYGLRVITLLAIKIFNKERQLIDVSTFNHFFHLDGNDDADNNKADDRNKFLRFLVYANLLFFLLMTYKHDSASLWFVMTFFSAYSSLFYVWDLRLRIKDHKNIFEFFSSKLNIADTILTLIALLSVFDVLINLFSVLMQSDAIREIVKNSVFFTEKGNSYSRFVLIIRPFAQLRIFSTIPKLKEITQTIVNSFFKILPAFFYFAVLFIIYAAVGHMLFKESGIYFVDFGTSIRSLFRIMTFESWGVLMEDTVKGHVDEIVVNIYYYSFIVFVSYIMWSVVQGLIVSSVQDTENKHSKEKSKKDSTPITKEALLERLDNLNDQMKQINLEIQDLKQEIKKYAG